MAERTIFLHGFSKAYAMTGFRIGYACGPTELIEAMMKIHQYSMLCASIIAQEAAIEALEHGEPATAEMREQMQSRRNFIVKSLNDIGLKCHLPPRAVFRSTRSPSVESLGIPAGGVRAGPAGGGEGRVRARRRVRGQPARSSCAAAASRRPSTRSRSRSTGMARHVARVKRG
jgi:hypothetical protein